MSFFFNLTLHLTKNFENKKTKNRFVLKINFLDHDYFSRSEISLKISFNVESGNIAINLSPLKRT